VVRYHDKIPVASELKPIKNATCITLGLATSTLNLLYTLTLGSDLLPLCEYKGISTDLDMRKIEERFAKH